MLSEAFAEAFPLLLSSAAPTAAVWQNSKTRPLIDADNSTASPTTTPSATPVPLAAIAVISSFPVVIAEFSLTNHHLAWAIAILGALLVGVTIVFVYVLFKRKVTRLHRYTPTPTHTSKRTHTCTLIHVHAYICTHTSGGKELTTWPSRSNKVESWPSLHQQQHTTGTAMKEGVLVQVGTIGQDKR
jgi:hypothetical protein